MSHRTALWRRKLPRGQLSSGARALRSLLRQAALLPKHAIPWAAHVCRAESKCRSNPACPGTLPIRPLYLVPGREAAPTLVPCDLGMGLPGHHTVQVQGLSFGHMGGGGLDVDGLGQSRGWGHREWVRRARLPGRKAGTESGGSDKMPWAHATQTQGWSPVVGERGWRTFVEQRARALLETQGREQDQEGIPRACVPASPPAPVTHQEWGLGWRPQL